MPFLLRVDVDKPYGRSNFITKILSKSKEDFWFPTIGGLGYLKGLEKLLVYCNENDIKGIFYFRNCTRPSQKIIHLMNEGKHEYGFHAENTRSVETFSKEIKLFKDKLINNVELHSFTKHGSGKLKLGKNHYPPFEPEKYLEWSKKVGVSYFFGNEIASSSSDFSSTTNRYYPKMFWLKKEYRAAELSDLNLLIPIAKTKLTPIIIHPANFEADNFVQKSLKDLVQLSKDEKIEWTTKVN
jgi:hypothetical protein